MFKTYTVQDGLVSNPIRKIFQDSKGFIWFITWDGISKFDGHQFINFTENTGLSFNLVNDIYETTDGRLLVAQNNGNMDIIRHDVVIQLAVWKNIVINRFINYDGKVIACTDGSGLYEVIEGKIIKPVQTLPRSTLHSLAIWKDSLIAGSGGDSTRIFNRRYELVAAFNSPEYFFNDIYTDSQNRLWAGTTTGLKLMMFPGQNPKEIKPSAPPAPFNIPLLSSSHVTSVCEDAAGVFWIGTLNGLIRISPDGNWQLYSDKDGLPSSQINCIFQDKEKNIWIGTSIGIAKIVTRNSLQVFTAQQGLLATAVLDLYRLNEKQMFIISGKGIQLYTNTNNSFTEIKVKTGPVFSGFIKESPVPLLFSQTRKSTGRYNFINKTIEESPSVTMYAGVSDSDSLYFAGKHEGLYLISKKKIQAISRLPYRITDLLIDKTGNLWAGTWADGLYKIRYTISKDTFTVVAAEDMTSLLPGKEIRRLFEDSKGNIWAGTRYNGVACLSANDGKNYKMQHWNSQHGLLANLITAIAEDSAGNIWLGSILGIDKLVRQDTGFRVFNFSRINNFYASITAILPGSANRLWMATNSGLLSIKDDQTENLPPLPVYLSSVLLGGEKNNFSPGFSENNISLGYRQNQASFEFSSPGFINEKQILYSYRLRGGEDTAWTKPANIHSISYANLQPGHYRFEVRSLGWNERYGIPVFFDFTIRPPFWKTGWFILLGGLFIIFCIYLFYRYRINQLVRLQKVRNRIAADLHDDIGSSLTNISILSELSKNNIQDPGKAQTFIDRIGEEVSSSGQSLDDIVWSINTQNDSLQQVAARMRRFASEIFDGANVSYSLQMEEQLGNMKLNMEQRRDVFLIFKEALNNVHKHAGAKNVMIKLWMENRHLHMVIADDGKGFDTNMATNRNGIKSLKQRVARWKGNLRIESAPGKGTTLAVYLPLKNTSLK
jgi:ligand-binding sensor domain-containing protein/two-component sensor histidine kinase